jgi:CheY-like chemotaxis protein
MKSSLNFYISPAEKSSMLLTLDPLPRSQPPLVGKILVVDDDPMLRDATSMMLASRGYEVIQAEDGQDALDQFRNHLGTIALVFMDVTMPRLGGIEATKMIREINPRAKVILSSGYSDRSPSEASPDAFLPKPFGFAGLHRIVQQVLQAG